MTGIKKTDRNPVNPLILKIMVNLCTPEESRLMARYEHLPIYREAYDLALHIEKTVRNFSRYHKYTLGTDLRNKSRSILEKIIEANNTGDRLPCLFGLRHELESFKITARLCHESGGFASTRSYLHLAERISGIAKQNEGWIRKIHGRSPNNSQGPKASESSEQQGAVRSQLSLDLG